MAPAPYLLHVNSRPTAVSNALWTEWYTKEHVPDLVNSKTSTRAAFYEEIPTPFAPNPDHPRKFLALYQTDKEECLKSDEYLQQVRRTSGLFAKEGSKSDKNQDNGDFDARNYHLIQDFDPNGIGESKFSVEPGMSQQQLTLSPEPPKNILTVYMNPENPEDFEKWYREEHLNLLAKLPGYRRTLRYKIGPKTPLTKDEDPPPYLAIHEVDDVVAFGGKEADAANTTPWTVKHIEQSKPFIARGWKLVAPEGF